ncbi:MAG: tellurite resistance TerB family protein [Geminicoccaceae bacterium]
MIDFKSVLGSILDSGLIPPSASQRVGGAMGGMGGQPQQAGGDLGSLLGGLLDNAKQAAGDTRREVQSGNSMAVGGLGALAGAILGGVRGSPAKGALGGAALAVLGQIAMSALQKGMAGMDQAGSQAGGVTAAGDDGAAYQPAAYQPGAAQLDENAQAELLLRAMINAAKADGQIDGTEMNNILSKLDEAGGGAEARDFVLAEMRRPLDLDGLAAAATTPDLAASIYAASAMAIRVDTAAERTYLAQLAEKMNLAPAVRASLDASMGVGRLA